jgi:hypothetical protein
LSADNDTYYFNFGSSKEFAIAVPILVQRFKEKNCWDLVEMQDDMNILDPVTNTRTPIVETIFEKVKPTIANTVNQKIEAEKNKYKKELDDAYKYVKQLRNNGDIDNQAMMIFLGGEYNLYGENMSRLTELKVKYELEFIPAIRLWSTEKKRFEAKAAACMRVFTESIGPAARNHIAIWLNKGEFRRAWYELNTLFGADKKDTEDIEIDEDFNAHIAYTYINNLYLEDQEDENNNEFKIDQEVNSNENTGNHNLNNPRLYPQKINAHKFEVCTECGKTGHNRSNCWLDIKCGNCGHMGHPIGRCRLLYQASMKDLKKKKKSRKASKIMNNDSPIVSKKKVSCVDNFVANLMKQKKK